MAKPFISSFFLLSFLLVLGATLSAQTPQWEQLPPTPELPKPDRSGIAAVNGIRIWYAVFGQGEPVIFIHGGKGSSKLLGTPGSCGGAPDDEQKVRENSR